MVYKVRSIWLTVALTALIAVGAGYFARQHARAYQVQAPRLPATVVEIPAGAIEPADPALAVPIPPAPVPAAASQSSLGPTPAPRVARALPVENGGGKSAAARLVGGKQRTKH